MTLATELLGAPDLAAVRRIVQSSEPLALREAVEPLAAEVLRLMRTDARTALDVADRVAIAADAVGDTRLRARADWVRGHGLSGVLRNREAAEAYARAATAYREVGDPVGEAKVAIGWINALMYLGEYPKAVTIGSRARDVLRRHHLHPEAARLSMNLGNVHHRLEQQSEALREYDRALRAARRFADPVMLRVIQFNRANVLENLGHLRKAEELYGMVRSEALAAGETRTAGFAEYSLGHLELLRGEYGRAYHRLETARTVFENLDDAHYHTLALTDLAELLLEINGFARAKVLAHRAQGTAAQHGMRLEAARSALLEGIACVELGEWERAQARFESARGSFRREGNRVAQALCSLYVAELDRRRGRRARASRRLREAAAVFAAEGLPLRQASTQLRLAGVEVER
ncbi:MAG: tetratricopeptide repeat protein, partial [bacterium]